MTRQPNEPDVRTRTYLPPRIPTWPATRAHGWPAYGGDELRARAWLWRTLGVGAASTGGTFL